MLQAGVAWGPLISSSENYPRLLKRQSAPSYLMKKTGITRGCLSKSSRKSRDEKFEIGRILHLKSKIRNVKLDSVQFKISDFAFEMQDLSNFNFPVDAQCVASSFGH